MRFIDEVKIEVRGGNGGAGSASFRREKYVPKGGPDGGNGGRGGHVIVVASKDRNTLQELYLKKRVFAEHGKSGHGRQMHGRNGKDVYIQVPLGTLIKDENCDVIFDLTVDGQQEIMAFGGEGGLGNVNFASSTNRAPKYAQPGKSGEEHLRYLELKSMADVGLVGLPNAGKSTLISKVSNARPKVADYPFTTLAPSLGQIFMEDGDGFVMADIPGLIAGAHEGKGLGQRFLRHVERTGVLLHLVDVVHPEGISITDQFTEVNEELIGYGEAVCNKQRLLVLNKMDAIDEMMRSDLLAEAKSLNLPCYPISAVSGEGVSQLLYDVYALVKAHRAQVNNAVDTQDGEEDEE